MRGPNLTKSVPCCCVHCCRFHAMRFRTPVFCVTSFSHLSFPLHRAPIPLEHPVCSASAWTALLATNTVPRRPLFCSFAPAPGIASCLHSSCPERVAPDCCLIKLHLAGLEVGSSSRRHTSPLEAAPVSHTSVRLRPHAVHIRATCNGWQGSCHSFSACASLSDRCSFVQCLVVCTAQAALSPLAGRIRETSFQPRRPCCARERMRIKRQPSLRGSSVSSLNVRPAQ
jgi:hypothetical protein